MQYVYIDIVYLFKLFLFLILIIMKDMVGIELSNDLYQKFLELKKTISSMTKDDISDEELI